MKQLIEEQKKQFEDRYNTSVLMTYPEYVESHMILLTDIWNWHISSIKQLIDGLIEKIEGQMVTLRDKEDHLPNAYQWLKCKNEAREEMLLHLKDLRSQIK